MAPKPKTPIIRTSKDVSRIMIEAAQSANAANKYVDEFDHLIRMIEPYWKKIGKVELDVFGSDKLWLDNGEIFEEIPHKLTEDEINYLSIDKPPSTDINPISTENAVDKYDLGKCTTSIYNAIVAFKEKKDNTVLRNSKNKLAIDHLITEIETIVAVPVVPPQLSAQSETDTTS